MKYRLLESLLPHLDAYERAYPQQLNPQHFAVWLARQTAEAQQVAARRDAAPGGESEEVSIGRLLVFLNRYVKLYARKALEDSPLGGVDEFVYLGALLEFGSMTKSDLIQRNRHEKPTGMEIIRRLLAMGFVAQADDPDDRRSKQLSITPAGQAVFAQAAERMQTVSQLLTGNLNGAERLLLLQLLEKLETFHQVVLAKTKGGDFEDLATLMR
jgi:MarR family transcriptional regulator, lower aerobic nicotinate degradation pathway regulator